MFFSLFCLADFFSFGSCLGVASMNASNVNRATFAMGVIPLRGRDMESSFLHSDHWHLCMWYLVRRATVVGVLTIHSQRGKGPESDTQICLRTFILNFLGSTLLVFSYSRILRIILVISGIFLISLSMFQVLRFPEQVLLALLTARVVQLAWRLDPEAQASIQVSSYCKDDQTKTLSKIWNVETIRQYVWKWRQLRYDFWCHISECSVFSPI